VGINFKGSDDLLPDDKEAYLKIEIQTPKVIVSITSESQYISTIANQQIEGAPHYVF